MSELSLSFRAMRLEDLDAVMVVEEAAYPIPWTRQIFVDSIAGKHECWTALFGEVVCGHAIVSNVLDETHLLNICIAPSFSRKGFGRQLLGHLIRQAIARHSSVFFLEVRKSNQAAIDLYFSEGFNEVGVRPGYYPSEDGREDAILMTLELSIDQYV